MTSEVLEALATNINTSMQHAINRLVNMETSSRSAEKDLVRSVCELTVIAGCIAMTLLPEPSPIISPHN